MQFLKDEVRNAIVAAALSEFMEKGYSGASMRAIARAAGITAGNIYRYFVTKDSLFNAIMDPVSRQIMDLVYADRYVEGENKLLDIDAIMESIMRLCRLHATEVHILLFKSEGSNFEGVRRKLAEMIARRVAENADAHGSKTGRMLAKESMAEVVSVAFVEGVSEIFKQSKGNIEILEENIRMLILFFFKDIYKGFAL